jgi:GNAT superfamily N-acetyltransferase
MKNIEIRGYQPGAIGRVVEMHGTYYEKYHGLGLVMESNVALGLAEFLNRFNSKTDGFWIAIQENRIIGSIAIDGQKRKTEGLRLRWFIVENECQGKGIGSELLQTAIEFSKGLESNKVILHTFAGLDAARHLYEKNGFILYQENSGSTHGIPLIEQMFELDLRKT